MMFRKREKTLPHFCAVRFPRFSRPSLGADGPFGSAKTYLASPVLRLGEGTFYYFYLLNNVNLSSLLYAFFRVAGGGFEPPTSRL